MGIVLRNCISILFFFVLISSVSAYNLNNGSLKLFVALANLSDTSGAGHTLTATGTPLYEQYFLGKNGHIPSDTNYWWTADHADFDSMDKFSISAAVEIHGVPFGGGGGGGILTKDIGGGSGTRDWRFFIDSTNKPVCGFVSGSNTNVCTGTDAMDNNRKYLFTCTYDGANIRMYIDAVLNKTCPFTGQVNNGDAPVQVGHYYFAVGAGNNVFNGRIGLVGYWKNRVLNQTEINALCDKSGSVCRFCNPVNTTCGVTATPVASMTLATSLKNNAKSNSNPYVFYFNGTVTNTRKNNFNCSLYKNGVYNISIFPADITVNQNFNFTTTGMERQFSFNVTCKNTNSTGSFKRTSIYIDTILPTITVNDFLPTKTYYKTIDYKLNISLYDKNLSTWSVNVIKNVSGTLSNKLSINNLSAYKYTTDITLMTNSSEWCSATTCYFLLNVTASDSVNTKNNMTRFTLTTLTVSTNGSCNLTEINETLTLIKTKQQEESSMYLLIFLPLILGLFAIIGAVSLGEEHSPMKIALFLFSFVTVITATYLASVIVGTTNENLQTALGNITFYGGIVTGILFFYFLIYAFYKMVRTTAQEEEKLSY